MYNNLDGNIRRLFLSRLYIRNIGSLCRSAVCYYNNAYTWGHGVGHQDDRDDKTGEFIYFIYLHLFTNDLY